MMRLVFLTLMFLAFCGSSSALHAEDETALWQGLARGETVAVMRHALAPGTGDPANFKLGDCATQRNLSDTGRAQARRIGGLFRANGIDSAQVFSSQWCRCMETAKLLNLGPVEAFAAINSFFQHAEREEAQTEELRTWIAAREPEEGPVVLVTHQVNITALARVFPASGEIIFVRRTRDGSVETVGRIAAD